MAANLAVASIGGYANQHTLASSSNVRLRRGGAKRTTHTFIKGSFKVLSRYSCKVIARGERLSPAPSYSAATAGNGDLVSFGHVARVVKGFDLKSNGLRPRRFEPYT